MTVLSTRGTRSDVWLATTGVVLVVLSFLVPSFTLTRGFSGNAAMLVHPGLIVDFNGFLPKALPDFGATTLLTWVVMLTLLVASALAFTGSRLLWLGGVVLVATIVAVTFAFVRAMDIVQIPLIEAGTAFRRLPFQGFGPSLWLWLCLFWALVALTLGLSRIGIGTALIARVRSGVVPIIAITLSLVVSGVVILALQSVPGGDRGPQGLAGAWYGRVDLLWFSYSTLFGPLLPRFRPILDFAPIWQSLALATPLIFTGLGLAFGFRTGLFNIGAAGQVTLGGLFCAAVAVYVPGPWFVVAPLAIIAAAVGGGLWGAIPGWLKGRFGASEVINTIMLNYIASGLLIFLIGSNEASFFGNTVTLPFKAPGGEAKSLEFGPGGRLTRLEDLPGIYAGNNTFMLTLPLLVLGAVLGWYLTRGDSRRRGVAAAIGGAVGMVVGFLLPRIPVTGAMTTASLNFSFILAILAAIFVSVFLWRTKWGYELRAVGLSPKAAEYGGVNIARNTVLALAISGALAGLAATHFTMGGALAEYRLKQVMPSESVGFGGITVALLGQNTPVGVVASSILFGVLGVGGLNLDQRLDNISREIVTVLQALIVLFIATRGFLSGDFLRSINNIPKPQSGSSPGASPGRNPKESALTAPHPSPASGSDPQSSGITGANAASSPTSNDPNRKEVN
jgi:simple sugar transport system permease protein